MFMTDRDWRWFVAVLIAAGALLGVTVFVGVPLVWNLAKPFLHAVTG